MESNYLNIRIDYYNIPLAEREMIKKFMPGKTCLNCQNGCCRVEYYNKVYEQECRCLGWVNYRMIVEQYNNQKQNNYTRKRKY